jgi:peptidoglycan/LPS O-acetylase OafA/YrhL
MRSEIRSLTGLRGLAALWVMIGHYIGDGPASQTVADVVEHMYLAVDIFMVLSGFVLARSHDADFRVPFAAGQVGRFLWRRLARIYPIYLASSLVCLLLIVTGIDVWGSPAVSTGMLLTNFAMAQSWGGPYDGLNAVSWSISTEWAANVIFPAFGFLFMRGTVRRSVVAVLVTVAGLLVFAAFSGGDAPDDPPTFGALTWYSYPGSMVRCTSEFMFGMFCWRLRRDVRAASFLGSDRVLVPAILLMAVMTLDQSRDMAFLALACGLVVGFSYETSGLAAVFASPVPRFLGLISFSLYLWHIPMLQLGDPITAGTTRLGIGQPWLVGRVLLMGLVIAVSTLSFLWVEKPAQRWLNHFAATRRGAWQAAGKLQG